MNRTLQDPPLQDPALADSSKRHRSTTRSRPLGPSTFEGRLLRRLLAWLGDPPFSVEYAGEMVRAERGDVARIAIRDRKTAWLMVADPLYQFGEAYAEGRVQVEGDLAEVLTRLGPKLNEHSASLPLSLRLMQCLHPPRGSSLAKARDNISRHYDIGTSFYQLWLDPQLVYTCAYYPRPDSTLEEAQQAKMDHVCRKLQLQPGQRVVEAGCGWGALALHMAEHYGVTVRAYNISHAQIEFARQQAARRGLADRVEFVEQDWRRIDEPCDAFVSVGMLEHVGRKNYHRLRSVIERILPREGVGLIHSIGQTQSRRINPWIERRIFPGAYPPTLREMTGILESDKLAVLDVENLRLHYALTLKHWLERFEQSAGEVRQMFDDRFVRMWRLYLAGSMAAFETGGLHLYQLLFSRSDNNRIAWTRDHLYRESPEVASQQTAVPDA